MTNKITPELAKSLISATTADTQQVLAHQRASQHLAAFELEVANDDRAIIISPKHEKKTRAALHNTLKQADASLKRNKEVMAILLAAVVASSVSVANASTNDWAVELGTLIKESSSKQVRFSRCKKVRVSDMSRAIRIAYPGTRHYIREPEPEAGVNYWRLKGVYKNTGFYREVEFTCHHKAK